jgi:GNAT superfamily N-acetyltransferase/predicted nucleic acid-binding protein
MTSAPKIHVEVVDAKNPHLPQVKKLGRTHSKTLGMMPDGAFDEYAGLGQILGAVTDAGECAGYLLYRVGKERATIAHLCVARESQGAGVSRALVERLVAVTKKQGLRGIGLRCRRDYDASRVWPRLGFIPLHDKPGKSVDGKELTFWWIDHQQLDLFRRIAPEPADDTKLVAVMDANVFFDLYAETDPESAESKALIADWLQDSVQLCLTDEILNEINRNHNKEDRQRHRAQARTFHIAQPPAEAVSAAQDVVRPFFPADLTVADESDLRQLSKTIAGQVQFFVTRDEQLLEKGDSIYDAFGVSILRPTTFINHIDALRRESEYQPARLGGSHCLIRHVVSQDEDLLCGAFQSTAKGEVAGAFLRRLRSLLATPNISSCRVAQDGQRRSLALYGFSRPCDGVLEVSLMRLGRDTLCPTIARHLLGRAIQQSVAEGRHLTIVTDPYLDAVAQAALDGAGFTPVGSKWAKINLGLAASAHELARQLDLMVVKVPASSELASRLSSAMKTWQALPDKFGAVELERALWPAKILDADLPCFIVPIKPGWAQSLFDEGLANQELFGERPELVLKREHVYYRANQGCGLRWPGRILWYVSADTDRHGSMSIRACSRLDEIVVDNPKELFRRFRRLGVYQWRDLKKMVANDPGKLLMALRFSDTELLSIPVPRERFRKLGVKSNLQSPVSISTQQFAEIYRLGTAKS